jgi:hypothetical protein
MLFSYEYLSGLPRGYLLRASADSSLNFMENAEIAYQRFTGDSEIVKVEL